MIVKMKKLIIVTEEKHAGETLIELRRLGVVHLRHMRKPHAHHITTLAQRLQLIDEALEIIPFSHEQKKESDDHIVLDSIKRILSLVHRKQELVVRCKTLDEKLIWFKRWGNVSLSVIEELKRSGIYLRLYRLSKRDLRRLPKDGYLHVVAREKGSVYCAFFGTAGDDSLPFPEIEVPSESLPSVRRKIFTLYKEMGAINSELAHLAFYRDAIEFYRQETKKKLEFYHARFGMHDEEGLSFLQGYCPHEATATITAMAKTHSWGLIIEDPQNIQEVPTLVRYPRWAKIIKPVFAFMGTVPGYREFDISSWFLIFFSLFFAMIIGDAGYGLIFLVLTAVFAKRMPHAPRLPFQLMYVLSGATIVWGAVTGTWFGYERIAQLPLFSNLIVPQLNSFVDASQTPLMHFCFFVGALHLTIAHSLRAVRYSNSRLALGQCGWIAIIWGVFFLVRMLVLEKPYPIFMPHLFIGGIALVVAFSSAHKNIAKAIGISIANLPLKLINTFADTLSYLRLFAIGYASVMVSASFNQMAQGLGFHNVVIGFFSALILVAGHLLNIVLGVMSVLVHGIRLNMLEFSGHLDMEWSGREYQPFAE